MVNPFLLLFSTKNKIRCFLFSSATPTENNNPYRFSTYNDTNDLNKKVSRPTSAISTNDASKSIPIRNFLESEPRSSMISPIDMPTSYDIFESGLPKNTSATSMLRSMTTVATSAAPTSSNVNQIKIRVYLLLFVLFY